jgi:hypothetical protein
MRESAIASVPSVQVVAMEQLRKRSGLRSRGAAAPASVLQPRSRGAWVAQES